MQPKRQSTYFHFQGPRNMHPKKSCSALPRSPPLPAPADARCCRLLRQPQIVKEASKGNLWGVWVVHGAPHPRFGSICPNHYLQPHAHCWVVSFPGSSLCTVLVLADRVHTRLPLVCLQCSATRACLERNRRLLSPLNHPHARECATLCYEDQCRWSYCQDSFLGQGNKVHKDRIKDCFICAFSKSKSLSHVIRMWFYTKVAL